MFNGIHNSHLLELNGLLIKPNCSLLRTFYDEFATDWTEVGGRGAL